MHPPYTHPSDNKKGGRLKPPSDVHILVLTQIRKATSQRLNRANCEAYLNHA